MYEIYNTIDALYEGRNGGAVEEGLALSLMLTIKVLLVSSVQHVLSARTQHKSGDSELSSPKAQIYFAVFLISPHFGIVAVLH